MHTDAPISHATGPRTPAGKAVSARNATTHGLFCRQAVLPHLGEDPAAYDRLLAALREQLRPRNLMESQYLELWAEASWKMRRLSRLEAQVWEDDGTDEDARLIKLERLARLQGGLPAVGALRRVWLRQFHRQGERVSLERVSLGGASVLRGSECPCGPRRTCRRGRC
ncbi:MAG: hypothetical protein JO250_15820 [Armatimonadetes bacterium]|nr:hypothetical protein [Armatimonadota bacterium]